ncbi:MAG: glycosyltransferase [Verrucomicrobiota bacterium]
MNETHYQNLKRHHTLSDVHLRQIDSALIPESAEPNQAFTILTPVYEPDIGFLNAAAESVLSQSYEEWEWILIDDGNTLEISTILSNLANRDPRIRLIKKETNQHIASALNSGLEKASNQWCCVLDQDDLLTTDALSIASEYLQEYPQASIFYSDEDKTNAAGDRFCEPYFKTGYQPDLVLSQNYLNHLTFFKAEEALTVSGFDDKFRGCQDWDFYLKIIELKGHNSVVHIPYVLYHWRQHTQSTAESIASKPYVLENSLECIRKRTPDDTDLEQFPSGYIIRKFKNRVPNTLELGYQISEQFESKPVGSKKWLITGDPSGIIDEVSRFSKDYEDCVILLSPIEQSLSTDIQANLYGYADQEHVAFAAPQVYSTVSCSYENAYSISDQGFARTASDPIGFESEGYFMNLRLPTNPDVLNLSFSCFRARNWLKYESQIRERSLLQLSRAVADSSGYFLWVPHLVKMDRLDSLFELDDGDHKSIVPKRHWVSPYRRFFASGDETLNSTKWTGLRSDRHE